MPSPWRDSRGASSATTSAPSRAPAPSAAWSSSRTASRGPASTAASASRACRGQDDFASHQEVLRRRFRRALEAEEGGAEQLRWRHARPRHHRRRQGPGQCGTGRPRRAGPSRTAPGRAGQGARGAVPARAAPSPSCCRRPLRRCTCSSDCGTRPIASPSPTTARCEPRRPPGRRSIDLAGVGPARKRALLRVFGSSRGLRSASVEEIAAVPGIGPAMAARIREHLDS